MVTSRKLLTSIILATTILLITPVALSQPEISQGNRINQTIFDHLGSLFSVTPSTTNYQKVQPGETISFTAEPVIQQDVWIGGKTKTTDFFRCSGPECSSKNLVTTKTDNVIWSYEAQAGQIYAWNVQITFPQETGYFKTETYLANGGIYTDKYEKFFVVGEDPDRDNVFGSNDQCPSVAGVSPHGCPDSDGDGVYDHKDQCPETGASEFGLTSDGCPVDDDDRDGLGNLNDECPETFGSKSNGCPTVFESFIHFVDGLLGTNFIGGFK